MTRLGRPASKRGIPHPTHRHGTEQFISNPREADGRWASPGGGRELARGVQGDAARRGRLQYLGLKADDANRLKKQNGSHGPVLGQPSALPAKTRSLRGPSVEELEYAAAFRAELRRFLHATDAVTSDEGLTPERYDLLLLIKAAAAANRPATVTSLREMLNLRQQAVTELVKRALEAGIIARAFRYRRACLLPATGPRG